MVRKVKFVDLFAGIGGIRLGLEQAAKELDIKPECIFASEIDKNAVETYKLNFNENVYGDLRNIDSLPDHDLLLAGFPCQAFSYAGKKKGFADTRGTLFFEIERLLINMRRKPQFIFLENVRGFTSHDKGRTCSTVLRKLAEIGYKTKLLVLNSSTFNVPQNRVRVYILGVFQNELKLNINSDLGSPDSHKFKKYVDQLNIFDDKIDKKKFVKDILEDKVNPKYYCSEIFVEQLNKAIKDSSIKSLDGVRLIDYRGGNSLHSWDLEIRGNVTKKEKEFMNCLIENRRKKKFGEFQDGKKLTKDQIKTFWKSDDLDLVIDSLVKKGYLKNFENTFNPVAGNMSFEVFKFLDPNSISITIVSSDANRLGVVQNGIPRRITPRECARIQGFPDKFRLNKIDAISYKQIGNSVSVPVVKALLKELLIKN